MFCVRLMTAMSISHCACVVSQVVGHDTEPEGMRCPAFMQIPAKLKRKFKNKLNLNKTVYQLYM